MACLLKYLQKNIKVKSIIMQALLRIIPVGAKVDLEGQRFAGPLFIGAQIGTSVLIK